MGSLLFILGGVHSRIGLSLVGGKEELSDVSGPQREFQAGGSVQAVERATTAWEALSLVRIGGSAARGGAGAAPLCGRHRTEGVAF